MAILLQQILLSDLLKKKNLGKDDVTDYLSICYSATDNIGHRFGPSSVEMGDAILRLDDDIKESSDIFE